MAGCEDWIALRGNMEGRASIKYDGKGELKEWHYIYKSGRRYKMGLAVWASPALSIIGGRPMAFIGGYDQTLHALDLIDKRVVWQKITNGEIATAPAICKVDGLDVVFWASADRTVYAYAAFSGRQLWTKELIPPSSTLGDCHISSPFLSGDRLGGCNLAVCNLLPHYPFINQIQGMQCLIVSADKGHWPSAYYGKRGRGPHCKPHFIAAPAFIDIMPLL